MAALPSCDRARRRTRKTAPLGTRPFTQALDRKADEKADPLADLQGRIADSLAGGGLPRVGPDAELERARIFGMWVLEREKAILDRLDEIERRLDF